MAVEHDLFHDLARVSALRGDDSTGIMYAGRKKSMSYGYHKAVIDPAGYFASGEYAKVMNERKNLVLIAGHCRSRTVGSITPKNAHPFHHGRYILMHNGTMPSMRPEGDKTDSETFAIRASEVGLTKAISSLSDADAYAFLVIDVNENKFHLVRNEKRTLWMVQGQYNKNTYMIASEGLMLDLVKDRRNSNRWGTPFLLDPDTLYTIDLRSLNMTQRVLDEVKTDEPVIIQRAPAPQDMKIEEVVIDEKETTGEQVILPGVTTPLLTDQSKNTLPFKPSTLRLPKCTIKHTVPPIIKSTPNCGFSQWTVDRPDVVLRGTHHASGPVPETIRVDNGPMKELRYIDYDGDAITPVDMDMLYLQSGCLVSKKRAKVTDKIVWLNIDEYVLFDQINDPFMVEYIESLSSPPRMGGLLYIPTNKLREWKKVNAEILEGLDFGVVEDFKVTNANVKVN